MKEIKASDSFIGLNTETRNCQNFETYDECKTNIYIENMKRLCGCLPLSLRLSVKVKQFLIDQFSFKYWNRMSYAFQTKKQSVAKILNQTSHPAWGKFY